MKYSEQMANYGDGVYRFISHLPLEVGDEVYVRGKKDPQKIKQVIEVKEDPGKWAEKKISNTIKI